MKLKLLFTLISILTFSNVFCQKVKYDGENINYIQYPLKPLKGNYKTYSFTEVGGLPATYNPNQPYMPTTPTIHLKKYEKVNKNGDLRIKVVYSPVEILTSTNGSNKQYYVDYIVTYSAHVEIRDANNNLLDSIPIKKFDKSKYKTQGPYADELTATNSAVNTKQTIREDLVRESANEVQEKISDRIDQLEKKLPLKVGYLKDDPELVSAAEKFKKLIPTGEVIKFDGTEKINKDEVISILKIWEKKSSEVDATNKDNNDLIEMYNYNIAIAYFLLGDYTKSKEYISKAGKLYSQHSLANQLKQLHIFKFEDFINTLEERLNNKS